MNVLGGEKMATAAQIKASNKYAKANTKTFLIKVSKKTETEILEKLESVENKSGYIKKLIYDDLTKIK